MMPRFTRFGLVLLGTAALAACSSAPPPPPPAPPPAPPKMVVIPQRPSAPFGLAGNVVIPVKGPDGVRHTVLVDSVDAQLVWNLRSAFNVAALSCSGPNNAEIVGHYRDFLIKHGKALTRANQAVDATYKAKFGKDGIARRETAGTQTYNYFAYPPTLPVFCSAALAMSRESAAIASKDLPDFSQRSFSNFARIYEDFYQAYEKYRVDLASWEAQYGSGQPTIGAGSQ